MAPRQAAPSAAAARSTSAGEVKRPIPIRKVARARASGSPSARSTWEGSTSAEEQADPVETQTSGARLHHLLGRDAAGEGQREVARRRAARGRH